ncbi:MAG TPA: hypothetical protein VFW90_04175 [Candidatus Saccharimonadales bacterium]|nr:hypothetical protein [Candidatus Saccharimonadales bacterium]
MGKIIKPRDEAWANQFFSEQHEKHGDIQKSRYFIKGYLDIGAWNQA